MKLSLFLFGLSSSLPNGAHAKCNKNKHFPLNKGYFIEGAAGYNSPREYDDVTRSIIINATWAEGVSYQDGKYTICTGMFCSPECKVAPGCPNLMYSTTCAKMRFCYPPTSGDDVWQMPDENALQLCDFSNAKEVCSTSDGKGNKCCEHAFEDEEEMELGSHGMRYFASKKNCNNGVKLAVFIQPYAEIGGACYDKGLRSMRIKDCECPHMTNEKMTLSEPCHTAFWKGCEEGGSEAEEGCCDTAPPYCINNLFNKKLKMGKDYEKARVKMCVDYKPGKCVIGGDLETKDCCTETCTSCGIKNDPFMIWDQCKLKENGLPFPMNMQCGVVKKHGAADTCDFTQCKEGDHWHMEGKAYKDWRKRTECHEEEYGVFARKVVGGEVKRTMMCHQLAVTKQSFKMCAKNTRGTADHHTAERVCPQTCNSCDKCYQNPNTRVFMGLKPNGKPFKYAQCKKIANNTEKRIKKLCAIPEGDATYQSPSEGCPQLCNPECQGERM